MKNYDVVIYLEFGATMKNYNVVTYLEFGATMKDYHVVIYFFTTLANILTLLTMINQALYLASVSFSFLAF